MTSESPARFRPNAVLSILLPLLAGWCVGFFLREVQATVIPYQTFLILGSLAGQLQFTPPHQILIGSQIGVIAAWLVWSWLLHRHAHRPLLECLARDAWSYVPLLVLPGIALLVDVPRMQFLKYLFEPLVLLSVATVCAIKAWHWTGFNSTSEPTHDRSACRRIWLLFGGAVAVFSILGVLQYHSWNVAHESSGSLEEMLWRTLHGDFLCTGYFGCNYLGYHAQLIELLWLPLYAVWPSMDFLTILQAIAVASGVFPVWWLARQKWDDRRAWWFAVLYLVQPSLHFAFAEVCYNVYRPETFLVPTVLFGIYFLERERWTLASLFGLLLLINREEMGLVVATAGVYVAWKKQRRSAGVALTFFGIAYVFVCMYVVIPHFNPEATNTRFSAVGGSTGLVGTPLLNWPGLVLHRLLDPANLLYVAYLVVPLGLLCCGNPSMALMALPMIGAAMMFPGGVLNSIYFHYHNAQFALLMAAAPSGAAVIAAAWANRFHCSPIRAQATVLTFALSAGLVCTVVGSKTPLSINFYYPSKSPFHYSALYQQTTHTKVLDRIQAIIPRESKVVATMFAATHFARHATCNVYPRDMDEADYLVLDLNARWKKGVQAEMQRWGEQGPPGFDFVMAEDGVFVFKRHRSESDIIVR